MKIILNLLKILLIIVLLFLLTQNANQSVSINLLNYSFQNVNLYLVIIVSLTIGAMLGAVFMAFSVLQSRKEVRDLKRKTQQLTKELENLRNVSIDEIPEQETPPAPPSRGSTPDTL